MLILGIAMLSMTDLVLSHTSLVYNKPSLGRLPSLSRYFTHPPPGGESQTRDSQNRATPDHWSVLLNSLCDLSVINNCIMSYVVEDEEIRRSPEDVENRLKLFNRLSAWKDELPVKLQCDGNPLINNYFLQYVCPENRPNIILTHFAQRHEGHVHITPLL